MILYYILRWLLAIPFFIMLPTRVRGWKNLMHRKGGLLVCHHTAYLDAILLGAYTLRPVHFIAKSELFKTGIGNWFFSNLGAFPVKRGTADMKAIKRCIELTKKGKLVGIFPEGTTKDHEIGFVSEMKQGVALIALKAKAPIIPIMVEGKTRVFRLNRMTVGESFTLDEYCDQKVNAQLLDEVADKIMNSMNALSAKGKQA